MEGVEGRAPGPSTRVSGVWRGSVWVWEGTGLRDPPLAPLLRPLGSCQGPDGSEGGRAGGLALRSEVLFSGGRGELGPDRALRPGGMERLSPPPR